MVTVLLIELLAARGGAPCARVHYPPSGSPPKLFHGSDRGGVHLSGVLPAARSGVLLVELARRRNGGLGSLVESDLAGYPAWGVLSATSRRKFLDGDSGPKAFAARRTRELTPERAAARSKSTDIAARGAKLVDLPPDYVLIQRVEREAGHYQLLESLAPDDIEIVRMRDCGFESIESWLRQEYRTVSGPPSRAGHESGGADRLEADAVDGPEIGRAAGSSSSGVDAEPDTPTGPVTDPPAEAWMDGPHPGALVRVPNFHGRVSELELLEISLATDSGPTTVVVVGMPGVGKTALVQQYATVMGRNIFRDGVRWLDAANLGPALHSLAEKLGWRGERAAGEQLARWIAERLQPMRMLLVLDSLPDDADLKLVPLLSGRSRVVITSRLRRLPKDLRRDTAQVVVACWDPKDAREYLRRSVPSLIATDDALDKLALAVGHLPLAMRLLQRWLERPAATPQDVLDRLRGTLIPTLDHVAHGLDRSVASTLGAAFADLTETQRRVLLASAVCARATTMRAIAATADVSESDAAMALGDLVAWFLVEHHPERERAWGLHDLVREYAARQEDIGPLRSRHATYVQAHYDHALTHALADPSGLGAEADELLVAVDDSLRDVSSRSWRGLLELAAFVVVGLGRTDELLPRYQRLVPSPHRTARLAGHFGLAECYRILGQHHPAKFRYELALKLAREVGDGELQFACLAGLASIALTNADQALLFSYAKVMKALREKGIRASSQTALLAMAVYSYAQLQMGAVEETRRDVEVAVAKLEQAGVPDFLMSTTLDILGICCRDTGQVERAIESHRRVVTAALQLRQTPMLIQGKLHLGQALYCANRFDDAIKELNDALERALASKSVRAHAQCHHALFLCRFAVGQKDIAEEHHRQAMRLFREAGLEIPPEVESSADFADHLFRSEGVDIVAELEQFRTKQKAEQKKLGSAKKAKRPGSNRKPGRKR